MNKTKLKAKTKGILNKYPLESKVDNLEDFDFLMTIFIMHPDWEIKKGCGVKYITVKKVPPHFTKCFHITRIDGSNTDISYIQCISPSTKIFDIQVACRTAVRNVILAFKDSVRLEYDCCPVTGELLTADNCHIDHYNKKFNELLVEWLATQDLKKLESSINNVSKDNETDVYFTDPSIVADFMEFHNRNTHLRAVSRTANLSMLK